MVKRIPMPGKELPQRAANDKRDNSRVSPSGRGKAAYGGFDQGGENPRAGSDGGRYSQPSLKGAAKTTQRAAEHAFTGSSAQRGPNKPAQHEWPPRAGNVPAGYGKQTGGGTKVAGTGNGLPTLRHESTPAAGNVPPRGNSGDMRSGMEKAMGAHADALHPVKKGRIADNRKPNPKMMSY